MKLKLFSILYLVSLWLISISTQENKLKQNEIDEDYDDLPRFFQVNTKSGLVLREKPDRISKKLAVLPNFENGFVIGQTRKKENINANDKMKVLDLDRDGIPEIYSTYESRGEASTCELFGYKDNSYRKIIFPTGDHYCLDMKIKLDGKIQIKENKKTLIYGYNKGNLSEVLQH